jgi:hypothetical protein
VSRFFKKVYKFIKKASETLFIFNSVLNNTFELILGIHFMSNIEMFKVFNSV